MTEMTNSIIHIHKVLRSRDTTDKNIQQTLICALGHHDLALTFGVTRAMYTSAIYVSYIYDLTYLKNSRPKPSSILEKKTKPC